MASTDILEEYTEYHSNLKDHGMAFAKFFELFQVNLGDSPDGTMHKGLHWGKWASDTSQSDETLKALKTYHKSMRSWIRKEKGTASPAETRRRMWFWVQKLREVGCFEPRILREITHWMDICIERTLEGCEMRIESVNGKPAYITDTTT
jgi:hypothetical protein